MGRRLHDAHDSSLELLLDTITNTFGGVLFLAILLAILAQLRSETALNIDDQSIRQTRLFELQQELATVQAELASLIRARAAQQSYLQKFASAELTDQFAKFSSASSARDELVTARLKAFEDIAQIQSLINDTATELQRLDADLESARADVIAARKALQTEIASRTRSVELPKMRSTSKLPIPTIVRYGKMYLLFETPNDRLARRINFEDFITLGEDLDFLTLTPKPYRGTPISEQYSSGLRQDLSRFRSASHYFEIAVWDDSFEEFSLFRTTLVDAGFEYRLLPMPEGNAVVETHVPDPQVQ